MKSKEPALFFKERRELRYCCEQLQGHLEVRTKLDREDILCLYFVVSDLKHYYKTRIRIVTMERVVSESGRDQQRSTQHRKLCPWTSRAGSTERPPERSSILT
jgi:hypothetical protein